MSADLEDRSGTGVLYADLDVGNLRLWEELQNGGAHLVAEWVRSDEWANLFIAARDLLVACETMLTAGEEGNPFAAGMIFLAVDLMHAAVAKAKGERP